ncbi:type II secretion system protein GspL [Serratia ureilytica]
MLPDVLALPLPGQCSALHWRNHWLIRTGNGQGMQLPDAWLGCASLPTPDWCLHRGGRFRRAGKRRALTDPLWRLAEEAWNSTFTLLQGRFKPSVRWPRRCPTRPPALLLLSGSLLVGGLHHQQMARQSESQIAALSRHLLPGQAASAFAEQAAKARVRRMQDALNAPQLFRLLPYAAGALALWAPPQLQALAFDAADDRLVVTVNRNDAAAGAG